MKSFKHIISYACDKNCSYCINEILAHKEKQCKDEMDIAEAYQEMAKRGYDHIMISGGEPVLNKMFTGCMNLANMHFEHTSVITAHNKALSNECIAMHGSDVLFSLHSEYLDCYEKKVVELDNVPFYASMVVETYMELIDMGYSRPLFDLKEKGFSGATIRECYPDGIELPEREEMFCPKDFSLRTYEKDNCVTDNVLMLPDLSLTTQSEFS